MRPRKKIEVDHDHPSRIRSAPGHGYVINLDTRSPVLAENLIQAGQAACLYSLRIR
jgi:hypothetical protein